MDDATQTVLVPLSTIDQTGFGSCGLTLGYVLDSVNNATLEAAAKRVVDKWRLLSGRLEWEPIVGTWAIRVPINGEVSSRVKFTVSKLDTPLDSSILPVDKTSTEILVRPSLKFFRHSSTPHTLRSYSSSNTPLVAIHITELTNCTCVGISVPHGVFDASGLGQIVHALHAELHAMPWSPPPFYEKNIVRETLNKLFKDALDSTEPPTALAGFRREFVVMGVSSLIYLGASMAYEHLWHKVETKAVYLGEKVVEKMVKKVKDELKQSGKGWISTGDILAAWVLKGVKRPALTLFDHVQTAYIAETDGNTVCATSAISIRNTLCSIDPAFKDYPRMLFFIQVDTYQPFSSYRTDNCMMVCSCPPLSKEQIASSSLAELALVHRQTVDAVRNIRFIEEYHRRVGTVDRDVIRRRGRDSWMFTNQVVGQLDAIDFGSGSQTLALWIWSVPFFPDHTVVLNKFKGGYMIQAGIRGSRWQAIADEIEKIKHR
ncbi:hypothetical protein H0H81_000276 [Sphagnurus paluster]|uniref:Uncharacterized protein n=1 Tax=Sphagnurus paluster TaxID=117069 RepID=A0A9P7K397_9AGAR|nr:hypothetical protein H0H81_000276 [Sphagnurus paluster]